MSIKLQPNGYLNFELTLPWSDLVQEYQRQLQRAARHVEIKGFRKGKAPLTMVEKHLDTNKLYAQAAQHLLSHAYADFVKQHQLQPLINPHITPLKTKPNQTWKFKVETAQKPQVKLGNYQTYLKTALKKLKPTNTKNDQKQKDQKLKLIFDTLLEKAEIEVCDLLIEAETQTALTKLARQLSALKLTLEDYAKSIKKSVKELVEDYKQTAQNNLKLEFVLQELVKQEKGLILVTGPTGSGKSLTFLLVCKNLPGKANLKTSTNV